MLIRRVSQSERLCRAVSKCCLPPIAWSRHRHYSAITTKSNSTNTTSTTRRPQLSRGVWRDAPWSDILSARTHEQCRALIDGAQHEQCPAGKVPVVCVSACLLGHPVAYHGRPQMKHINISRLTPVSLLVNIIWKELRLVECVPICPEMELLSLPSPRPPIKLVQQASSPSPPMSSNGGEVHVVTATAHGDEKPLWTYRTDTASDGATTADVDDALRAAMAEKSPAFTAAISRADGFVLKARSPSCGVRDARVYNTAEKGSAYTLSDGFFAGMVRQLKPNAPLTSERQLLHMMCPDEYDGCNVPASSADSLDLFLHEVLCHFESRNKM